MLPYKSVEEAHDRITSTIIFYGDTPVYIHRCMFTHEGPTIFYHPLPVQVDADLVPIPVQWKHAPLTDPKWRANDLLVGYVNKTNLLCEYITRMPVRRYKQGLCGDNLNIPRKLAYSTARLFPDEGFASMLKGEYPSFKEVIKTLLASHSVNPDVSYKKAFHRQLAVSYSSAEKMLLHYRGAPIGRIEDGVVFLTPKNYWIREFLESQNLKVQEHEERAA